MTFGTQESHKSLFTRNIVCVSTSVNMNLNIVLNDDGNAKTGNRLRPIPILYICICVTSGIMQNLMQTLTLSMNSP